MKKLRLSQYLTRSGLFTSKSEVIDVIRSGKIVFKDKVRTNPNFQVKKNADVFYENKKIILDQEMTYIIINKPKGYLSSKLTENDITLTKKSVFDLLKDISDSQLNSLSCAGRLDENSSGLLIITNDGKLIHKLTNPRFEKSKSYLVELEHPLSDEDIKSLETGVDITLEENGEYSTYHTLPCKIKKTNTPNHAKIELTEGKKRQVRRMFRAVNNKVLALKRHRIGQLELKDLNLKEGQYLITTKEFILKHI